MPRIRSFALVFLCAIAVALFCALGFWQLSRHRERVVTLESQSRRLDAEPLSRVDVLSGDSMLYYRRVSLAGRFDLANEIILMNRTRHGAPGVHLLTPLILEGSDSAILVNRGWVYSPDGSTVDVELWREDIHVADSTAALSAPLQLTGLLLPYPLGETPARRMGADSVHKVQRLQRELVSGLLPYPLAPLYIQLLAADTLVRRGVPTPLPPPTLTAGSHLSYAIQWFAFAAITVVGCVAVLIWGARGSERPGDTA
jgi:surfeit locus 1 family protein